MSKYVGRKVSTPENEGNRAGPHRKRTNRSQSSIHQEIGERLRALYAEAEQEPLPRDLISLLEMLDKAEGDATKKSRGGKE